MSFKFWFRDRHTGESAGGNSQTRVAEDETVRVAEDGTTRVTEDS